MEYQKYKSLKCHFDLTNSKEDAHEFCQQKSQFADILNYTKENQSIENFLIFFSHFMNYMYEIDLKNAEYQHCKIDFIPPDQVTLTGSIVVTLIDIYESADIRIIF